MRAEQQATEQRSATLKTPALSSGEHTQAGKAKACCVEHRLRVAVGSVGLARATRLGGDTAAGCAILQARVVVDVALAAARRLALAVLRREGVKVGHDLLLLVDWRRRALALRACLLVGGLAVSVVRGRKGVKVGDDLLLLGRRGLGSGAGLAGVRLGAAFCSAAGAGAGLEGAGAELAEGASFGAALAEGAGASLGLDSVLGAALAEGAGDSAGLDSLFSAELEVGAGVSLGLASSLGLDSSLGAALVVGAALAGGAGESLDLDSPLGAGESLNAAVSFGAGFWGLPLAPPPVPPLPGPEGAAGAVAVLLLSPGLANSAAPSAALTAGRGSGILPSSSVPKSWLESSFLTPRRGVAHVGERGLEQERAADGDADDGGEHADLAQHGERFRAGVVALERLLVLALAATGCTCRHPLRTATQALHFGATLARETQRHEHLAGMCGHVQRRTTFSPSWLRQATQAATGDAMRADS